MRKTRQEYEQDVARPGKFEQEAPYVPYFWECYLNGCANDDGEILSFVVSEKNRKLFPELELGETIRLRETNSGFVVEI